MNPGGSVKDRAAWGLVKWAEENGEQLAYLLAERKPDESVEADRRIRLLQARSSPEEPLSRVLLETLVSRDQATGSLVRSGRAEHSLLLARYWPCARLSRSRLQVCDLYAQCEFFPLAAEFDQS